MTCPFVCCSRNGSIAHWTTKSHSCASAQCICPMDPHSPSGSRRTCAPASFKAYFDHAGYGHAGEGMADARDGACGLRALRDSPSHSESPGPRQGFRFRRHPGMRGLRSHVDPPIGDPIGCGPFRLGQSPSPSRSSPPRSASPVPSRCTRGPAWYRCCRPGSSRSSSS